MGLRPFTCKKVYCKVTMRPSYISDCKQATNCRQALSHKKDYVKNNLIYFSERETRKGYENRILVTPNPPDLRISFNRLLYSIRARIGDVYRESKLDEYIDMCNGVSGGIDGTGSTMISFISHEVLRELLTTGVVGVFCSREDNPSSLADEGDAPKLSVIPIESLVDYRYEGDTLVRLKLKTKKEVIKDGYVASYETVYDEYILTANGVIYRRLDEKNHQLSTKTVDYSHIPCTILTIEESPVAMALDAHNALLQLSSSDFWFLNKSNYPIYVEQYDPGLSLQEQQIRKINEQARVDSEQDSQPSTPSEREVGVEHGIKYHKGADAPGFIAPPTEHLRASEEKQAKMRQQIEEIMAVDALRVSDKQQSSDSKREEKEALVGNIQLLFDMFERLEREQAQFIHEYLGSSTPFRVDYPKTFDLRTENKRLESAEDKLKLRDDIASLTFKKALTLSAVSDCLPGADKKTLEDIEKEINEGDVHVTMAKLTSLLGEGGVGIKEVVTALGLDEKRADEIIQREKEKLAFIQSTQTGMANIPGEGGQPPKHNEGEE